MGLALLIPVVLALPEVDTFNYVVGTQTIGAAYQFTGDSRLLETAQAIRAMGSSVIKFAMNRNYGSGGHPNVPQRRAGINTLTDLARDEPSHRAVLDLPFADTVIWAYCFTPGWWNHGFKPADREREYRELYDFACWLFRTYSGTGKRFYLGHWEGDWHLRDNYDVAHDEAVRPEAVEGMIAWLNTRQQAVDDARRDTPHTAVEVWHYTEVNLVKIARQGCRCVTNSVLPHTAVDYVSYSSYDCQLDLKPALDYIESKLPPKPSVSGKRVFVGEYGFPADRHSPAKQDELSRRVMRAALEWGCPFVLYWEFYNNEVTKDGRQRGFWMIDDQGVKQPIYETHRALYAWARLWVAAFRAREGRPPTGDEYRRAALEQLAKG